MNPTQNTKQRQLITLAGTVVFIAFIGYYSSVLISHVGKIPLSVHLAPGNASLTIDGKSAHGGTIYTHSGTHTLVAKEAGFQDKTESIIVTKGQSNAIVIALNPLSNAAKKYAASHESEYLATEQIGGQLAEKAGEVFAAKNPITNKLPFDDPYFEIGYVVDTKNVVTVTVHTVSPLYRYYALKQIRSWGYDPTTLKIKFNDFVNPLGS